MPGLQLKGVNLAPRREGLEPIEQVPHRLRRDLGLGHHLLEPLLISHDHGDLPGEGPDGRNQLWFNRLQPVNRVMPSKEVVATSQSS